MTLTSLCDICGDLLNEAGENYLVVVRDVDSERQVSRYVKNLDEWYEGFILQQPSIFAGLNDLDDSSYPETER